MKGQHVYVGDTEGVDWRTIDFRTPMELHELWRRAYMIARGNWPEWRGDKELDAQVRALPKHEVMQKIAELESEVEKKYRNEFRKFRAFHVDKPLVDFISVEPEFRRNRIGEALYREAAKWMAERGMKLHASGVQSKDAEASWQSMENQGMVERSRKRRFLKLGAQDGIKA
jgi:GNAT superfamily N-acetyltransferase